MGDYKHILYATDLAKESEAVAKKAKKIAAQCGAKLSIIHVIEHVPAAYVSPVVLDVEEVIHREAEKALCELCNKLEISEDQQYLTVGSAKMQILQTVKDIGADLLIVGSHGRHGLALLMGSTANAVLHGAPCDVLAIRVYE